MAYIVLTANGQEIDRRELRGTLVIGRANDCDVAVHDILLSRRHCRIEPAGSAWRVVDLASRNGTRIGWERVEQRVLSDGDCLRVGRTVIRFSKDPYEAPPEGISKPRTVRPADPFEALHGTVAGFVYRDEDAETADDEPISPELAALAESGGQPASRQVSRAPSGTTILEPSLGTRRMQRPMPSPQPYPHAQARRLAYLQRLNDVSLHATPQPRTVAQMAAVQAGTDWKLVAMLLGACVITLAIAFVLKP